MALCTVRLRRAAVMEAEYIDSKLACRTQADPATTRPRLSTYQVENLNKTYHRYEAAIENRLFRTLKHFQDLRKTESQGFENVEGAAPSRPRRCRRRRISNLESEISNRPVGASTPPSQTPEIQPDPTMAPLHYQTDLAPPPALRIPAPPDEGGSATFNDSTLLTHLTSEAPASASPINSVPTATGMDDSSEAAHHDSSLSEAASFAGRDAILASPINSTHLAPDEQSPIESAGPATPADSHQNLLTERFYTILNNMDLTHITEWIQDNPGRLLELMRLLDFQAHRSALRDKVRLEVTKLNDAIKASRPSALASTEVDEESTVKLMTAYFHAMNKYMGVG
jgi:hypothetical protein